MMWVYVGDVGNWAAARLLDSAARGDDMPGWAPEAGWVAIFAAVLVLAWLGLRSVRQRRVERVRPESESLTKARPWLAEDGNEVPGYRYRGRRRAHRYHHVPAHPLRPEVAATQIVPRVSDDPEATAVLVRPRSRWGGR